ncbi:MAG TPA: protein-tyrosine phosphatase family protein [Pyrinomonadaceae bacterium]|nr:protein-tyrosine phosphatase family protein [Pyrinomonadaceae bacterium]
MTNYLIEGPWPGRLAIVPRPRGGDWLEDELHAWKTMGFDVVVSLLTKDELDELGLAAEADISRAQGLQFCEFPIPDLGIPKSSAAARELVDNLRSDLDVGKQIAIHCRQGIGRSGLIAASVLIVSGVEPELAIRQVSAARGLPVPETAEQREWVLELARDSAASLVKG